MLQKKLKIKDIDLLDAYKKKKEPSKYASILKYAILPIALCVIVCTLFGYNYIRNNSLSDKINDIDKQIVATKYEIENSEEIKKAQKLSLINSKIDVIRKIYKDINSYPVLSQNTFDTMIIAANLKITITSFSYTRENPNITIQTESTGASETEEFVRRLKSSEIFSKVSYTGYSYVEKETESAVNEDVDTSTNSSTSANDTLLDILQKATQGQATTKNKEVSGTYTATITCTLR